MSDSTYLYSIKSLYFSDCLTKIYFSQVWVLTMENTFRTVTGSQPSILHDTQGVQNRILGPSMTVHPGGHVQPSANALSQLYLAPPPTLAPASTAAAAQPPVAPPPTLVPILQQLTCGYPGNMYLHTGGGGTNLGPFLQQYQQVSAPGSFLFASPLLIQQQVKKKRVCNPIFQ